MQCTLEELTYRTEREVTLELIAINSSPLKLNTLSPAAPGFGARGPRVRGLSDPLRSCDQDRPTTVSVVQPLTEHGQLAITFQEPYARIVTTTRHGLASARSPPLDRWTKCSGIIT